MAFMNPPTTNGDCDCDCGCDDCSCCGNKCSPTPTQINGSAPGKVVVRTGEDYRVSRGVNQVDSIAATAILLTLAQAAIVGDEVLVNACGADVRVEGGALDIMGQDPLTGVVTVPGGSSALFTLTSCCDPNDPDKTREWSVLLGQNLRCPECVPDLATLAALKTTSLDGCCEIFVETLQQSFRLDPTSTAAADGITILKAKDGPGNWLRNEIVSKKWSLQINWFIDPVNGDDENDGSAATQTPNTRVGPLKSVAESNRRLPRAQHGRNYQKNVSGSVPLFEATPRRFAQGGVDGPPGAPVLFSDRWVPCFTSEPNPEDVSATNGFEQTFNESLVFPSALVRAATPSAVLATGTITAAAATAGNNQQTATGSNNGLTSNIGQMVVITASAIPTNVGATAGIGAATGVLNEVRTTRFLTPANAQIVPAIGDTFAVIRLAQWAPPITQVGSSQGRYQVANAELPSNPAAPAEQSILTEQFERLTWSRCRFRRGSATAATTSFELSVLGSSGIAGCIFDYSLAAKATEPALPAGPGVGGTYILGQFSGQSALTATLFLNTDIQAVFGSVVQFNSCYGEGSLLETVSPTGFTTYGFFGVAAGTPFANILLLGQGLLLNGWPVAALDPDVQTPLDAAVRINDGAVLVVANGANLGGSNATAGSIGLRVAGGAKFLWHTQGAGNIPTITGALADLRLEDAGVAIPAPELFPASWTPPTTQSLVRWGIHWDTNFARKAMNYGTGSVISQVTS